MRVYPRLRFSFFAVLQNEGGLQRSRKGKITRCLDGKPCRVKKSLQLAGMGPYHRREHSPLKSFEVVKYDPVTCL